jgi:short-subunit dehydrogenase
MALRYVRERIDAEALALCHNGAEPEVRRSQLKNIAIVTGASSGIGREFITQFNQGMGGALDEIWAIARNREKLEQVAATSQIPVKVVPLDLLESSSFDTLGFLLASEDEPRVQWLINSAGFGKTGSFMDVSREDNANMVRLNCLAVVEMCYAVLPYMVPGSRIVNLASVAGFLPLTKFAVYSASKDFVINFSYALDSDLKGSGIRVTAVCPKWMKTGFMNSIGDEEAYRGMTVIGFDDPKAVVNASMRASVLGAPMCTPSSDMQLARFFTKILPVGLTIVAFNALTRLKR